MKRRRDLLQVVGDEHDRGTGLVACPLGEIGDELLAAADVEAGRRLVEEDDTGLVHQHAGEQHTLAFARRQRRERVIRQRAGSAIRPATPGPEPDPPRCTGATREPTRRSARSSPPRPPTSSARAWPRAPVTRTRCVPGACARRYARAVDRGPRPCPSTDVGTATRCAAATSCPRRSRPARPNARWGAPSNRCRRESSRRRSPGRRRCTATRATRSPGRA